MRGTVHNAICMARMGSGATKLVHGARLCTRPSAPNTQRANAPKTALLEDPQQINTEYSTSKYVTVQYSKEYMLVAY